MAAGVYQVCEPGKVKLDQKFQNIGRNAECAEMRTRCFCPFSMHFIGKKRDGYFDGVVIFAKIKTIRSNYKLNRLSMKCKY